MTTVKTIAVSALVALAVVFFARFVFVSAPQPVPVPPLAGQPGPENTQNYTSIGGIGEYRTKFAINSATSSVFCSVPYPTDFKSGTSTVITLGTTISTGTAQNQTFDISTTTTSNLSAGSSTPSFVRAHSVLAGARDSLVWRGGYASTTVNALYFSGSSFVDGGNPFIWRRGENITWRLATATPSASFAGFGGTCSLYAQEL